MTTLAFPRASYVPPWPSWGSDSRILRTGSGTSATAVVAGREGRHFTIDSPQGVISFVVLPASTDSLAKDSLREGDTVGVFEKRGDILLGAFGSSAMEGAALRRLMKGVFT
jgi:hypothetical protein